MSEYFAIGTMSGTSLDGLDLAYCKFTIENEKWDFEILKTKEIPFSKEWKNKLGNSIHLSGKALFQLDADYGLFIGQQINQFVQEEKIPNCLIGSHGYTVFHEPEKGFTTQIGNGAVIAAQTGRDTICDFRSLDVALKGEGAPLVPYGDSLLYNKYVMCINLGGIANYSTSINNTLVGKDICPFNLILNPLAQQMGKEYDDKGEEAAKGNVHQELVNQLMAIPLRDSLEAISIDKTFNTILNESQLNSNDKLATCSAYIAQKIQKSLPSEGKVLLTGGGTFNTHIIDLIKKEAKCDLIVPEKETIAFKEAMIFAFLGVLRVLETTNVASSVTGSIQNNCGGAYYKGA